MAHLLSPLRELDQFHRLRTAVGGGGRCAVTGPRQSGAAAVLACLLNDFDGPALALCPTVDRAEELAEDVNLFAPGAACYFPAFEALEPDEEPDEEIITARMSVLRHLALGPEAADMGEADRWLTPGPDTRLVVTDACAFLQATCRPDQVGRESRTVEEGAELPPHELVEWLVDHGFHSVPRVERPGQYCMRGGILDVYSHGAHRPVRVEFFGDTVDSLRRFDASSQLSKEKVERCELMAGGSPLRSAEERQGHLLSFLPADAPAFVLGPADLSRRVRELWDEEVAATFTLQPGQMWDMLADRPGLAFGSPEAGRAGETVHIDCEEPDSFGPDLDAVLRELDRLCDDYERVVVFCISPAEEDRFRRMLDDREFEREDELQFRQGRLNHGLLLPDAGLALVPHQRLFHRYRHRRLLRRREEGQPVAEAEELEPGDLVVHVKHGIARFRGLRTIEDEGRKQEHLELEFADDVRVYVPADSVELVHRYIGIGGGEPSLSKVRGKSWTKTREKAEEAVEDLAAELLKMQAVRQTQSGISAPEDGEWQRQFEAEFPFEETEDQDEAIKEVKEDMEAERPMDRLLCGDVGYGKTEVAMRAAFKAVMGGRQVAVLVPTTVLAQQHYRTFRERMADYPIRIEMLSRFLSGSETRAVLEGMADGRVDIVIGTHRLVQSDVTFKNLGLVIIDEEQRFGVEHKEKLKQLRTTVDVLTMTATPIPRTLHMSLMGLKDISSLQTPPRDRYAIETHVRDYDPDTLRTAVRRELNRDGQVFVVHNRVNSIDRIADRVRNQVPEADVAIAHGRMNEKELATTMEAFMEGMVDVLVCTTIIENGLDIPNANTMIIDRADLLGLAEMHQLRGRIGRYIRKAYAYLFTPPDRPITPDARDRLDAIKRYSRLGAGFDIALRDLEIRGAGNILGPEQSGHIAAVGYKLYCRLLERAVRSAKGEEVSEPPAVTVSLGLESHLPDDYVPAPGQKVEVYRELNRASDLEDVHAAGQHMRDRFGPLPQEAENLLLEAEIRVLADRLGISSIRLNDGRVFFDLSDREAFMRAAQQDGRGLKMLGEAEAFWTREFSRDGRPVADELRELLNSVEEN